MNKSNQGQSFVSFQKSFSEQGKTLVPFDAHKTLHPACAQPAHTIAHNATHNPRAQPSYAARTSTHNPARTTPAHMTPPHKPNPCVHKDFFH